MITKILEDLDGRKYISVYKCFDRQGIFRNYNTLYAFNDDTAADGSG